MNVLSWAVVGLFAAGAGVVGWWIVHLLRDQLDKVPPEFHAAATYVWSDLWKMAPVVPSLFAVKPRNLNCHSGHGWLRGPGDCIAGASAPVGGSGECTLAIWPGAKPSETALVHELRHVRRWIEVPGTSLGEPEEAAHASPGFNVDIDAANALLASRGQ